MRVLVFPTQNFKLILNLGEEQEAEKLKEDKKLFFLIAD